MTTLPRVNWRRHVTPLAWPYDEAQYGADETYRRAAVWLGPCAAVADWGGATGAFSRWLPPAVAYTVIDGTLQRPDGVLADLTDYHERSDGILLRQVLDNTPDWRPILENALAAFLTRLVVVTFVPEGPQTHCIDRKSGWPYWQFHADDLRARMQPYLVHDEAVPTTHPEHVYYLERPR